MSLMPNTNEAREDIMKSRRCLGTGVDGLLIRV